MKKIILTAHFLGILALTLGTFPALGFTSVSYSPFSAGESSVIVTIRADGTCSITNTTTQPRKQLEAQVRAMERVTSIMEEDEEESASEKKAKAEPAPINDEELFRKYRETLEQRGSRFGAPAAQWKVEKLESAGTNDVGIVTTVAFSSVKEMMGQGAYVWGPTLLMMDDSTVQMDTNNQLRITFSRDTEGEGMRYAASQIEKYLKRVRSRQEWILVLPGKIAGSGFPKTDGNTTSIVLDPDNAESMDAVSKLIKLPEITVVADPAGLTIDGVLKSSELTEQTFAATRQPEVPVTDAGPGFVAEPETVSITTVYEFPEAKERTENQGNRMRFSSSEREGVVVRAKLFPPKGRIIKSATGMKVTQATDDQGRPVKPRAKGRGTSFTTSSSGNNNESITLHLEVSLPEPDAKAIDELQAEAVVLSIGGYKDMVLTNAEAEVKKEIDLSSLLPGTKLVIQKAVAKGMQTSLDLTVTGPKEARNIEFVTGAEDSNSGHSSTYDRNSTEKDGIVTRTVQVQNYQFGMGAKPKDAPIQLRVRMPQDYKNERVKFALTALDLL